MNWHRLVTASDCKLHQSLKVLFNNCTLKKGQNALALSTPKRKRSSDEYEPNLKAKPEFLFLGCHDGDLIQYYPKRQMIIWRYSEAHSCRINSIKATHDSLTLFTADDIGHLKVWDIQEQKFIAQISNTTKYKVNSLAITSNGHWLFAGDSGGFLQQINIKTRKCLKNKWKNFREGRIHS